jgi:hypothetical protein
MADLSITAANVKIGDDNTLTKLRQAGEAITQGQPYYVSTTDGKAYQTDANDGVAKAAIKGVALLPAALDGYFYGAEKGQIVIGATVAIGTPYVVSATKGAICPLGDITSGQFIGQIGYAITTTIIDIQPIIVGVAKA